MSRREIDVVVRADRNTFSFFDSFIAWFLIRFVVTPLAILIIILLFPLALHILMLSIIPVVIGLGMLGLLRDYRKKFNKHRLELQGERKRDPQTDSELPLETDASTSAGVP
jgi:hypothetical protein